MTRRTTCVLLLVAVVTVVAVPALAAEGGHEAASTPLWKTLLKWVNLFLFVGLLAHLIGKPLARYLEARGETIHKDLAEAQERLAESESLRERLMVRIQEVEQEVAEIRERAETDGAAEAARIREQATAEEQRFLARVDHELERRGAELKQELAAEAAALTRQLTLQLLERETTNADRKRVLKRSLEALESAELRG